MLALSVGYITLYMVI